MESLLARKHYSKLRQWISMSYTISNNSLEEWGFLKNGVSVLDENDNYFLWLLFSQKQ